MSSTVDIGIDLGTTNSVAAVMENGRPVVVKNVESDVTPSFVGVSSQGQILTGQEAKNLSRHDSENVADGFKRFLGKGQTWRFPANGQSYSAINLAAILLRDIRQSISEHINEEPYASVITVPAAFGEVEKHAVALSAREAGFTQVTLVQEPVAAGLAYGWAQKADRKPFLVYDVGGGTFDAALMESKAGQLIVRANSGEHTLGGRELDAQILDKLLLPQIAGKVDPASLTNDARSRLSWRCEQAKIKLSRSASATVALEGCVRSVTGTPMVDALTITRADYEPLVIAFVDRTIEIVLRLLLQAGVVPKDLGAVMLVGGPSKTPVLRRRLEERLQVAPDVIFAKLDPMTVVAEGAALYAASVEKSASVLKPTPLNALKIRIIHDSVTSLSNAPVGIAIDGGSVPDGTMIKISRQDGLWTSGLIPIREGKAVTQVSLVEGQQSHFKIDFLTPSGTISVHPDQFSILQGISAVSPPLSRSIGVILESGAGGLEVQVLAQRGMLTPLTVRSNYRTTRGIKPGDPESGFTIRFVEGESPRPLRNKLICEVPIKGTDVDRPLPIGTEVEITLRIDPSASAVAKVFFTVLGKTFTRDFLDVNVRQDPVDLPWRLATEAQRLKEFADAGMDVGKLEKELPEISRGLELAITGDRDSLARAEQQLDALAQEIDAVEERAGPQIALKLLSEAEAWADRVIGDGEEETHKRRLVDLKAKASAVRSSQNTTAVQHITDLIWRLAGEAYWRQTGPWIAEFKNLVDKGDFIDQTRASQLISEGRMALDTNDRDALIRVVLNLGKLARGGITDPNLARFGGLVKLQ